MEQPDTSFAAVDRHRFATVQFEPPCLVRSASGAAAIETTEPSVQAVLSHQQTSTIIRQLVDQRIHVHVTDQNSIRRMDFGIAPQSLKRGVLVLQERLQRGS